MLEVSKNPVWNNLSDIGYYVSKEGQREEINSNEPHIHKQRVLNGVQAETHKLTNNLFTYFPKGFSGSKNSDFYEFLSLGKVPYLIGSLLLIGLYTAAIGKKSLSNNRLIQGFVRRGEYDSQSASAAMNVAKKMGAGVVLYGIGKWLSKKVSHKLISASTGVNLDMKYTNIIKELPEPGKKVGLTRIEYPGVFDSADFPRKDLVALDNQLNHNNIYHYEDKLAKKAGFKEKLNAPNQTMWPKIRELKVRATALENVSQYIAAATGVAIGAQNSFEKLNGYKFKFNGTKVAQFFSRMKGQDKLAYFKGIISNIPTKISTSFSELKDEIKIEKEAFKKIKAIKPDLNNIKNAAGIRGKLNSTVFELKKIKNYTKNTAGKTSFGSFISVISKRINEGKGGIINNAYLAFKGAVKELWKGNSRNKITKYYGKALIIGTIASTLLTWLIPTINFKKNQNTMKSKVNTKKGYEVC